MKPAEYWRRRSEEVAARQFAKADAYLDELTREYARATEEIRRAIEVFYQRYAVNGEVSMAEARRQLSGAELRRFKMTLEEFTAKAKNNADGRWTQQLNEVYYRVRVSRYEALLTQIQQQVEMLAGSRQKGTGKLLGDVYTDTYYRTIYEIQRGTGFGTTFTKIDQDTLEKVLGTEFAGSNWSKRIWGDRDKLVTELRTKLAQAFIRGESAERTSRDLAERMGVPRSNAERLIQTETAFFVGEATAAGYKASGVVDRYEILSTLDSRTSDICRSMDGKVFNLSEREVSINYPPFHARCRTTVVPFFEDEINPGERIARDEKGETYYVPGDMKYEQWHNQYVRGTVEEPPGEGFNRKYNPKASYYADLPGIPESVLEKVAETNRSIARQGSKEGKEIMILLDLEGRQIGRATGAINKVAFTEEIHKTLLATSDNSVILTHNHPRGTRINVKDIRNFAIYSSLGHIVAVGHDGGISFVSTNGKIVDLIVFNSVLEKTAYIVKEALQRDKKYGTMSSKAREEYFDFMWMQAIIKELGWSYGEDFEAAKRDNRFN